MDWILITFKWYLYLLAIGIIFFPLTKKIFSRFSFDFSYPIAKTIGILLISYSTFILGIVKLAPFSRNNLMIIIGIFLLINYVILKKDKKIIPSRLTTIIIVFEELLFLAALFFWTYVRSQEPSIRSLEKFMDFGFINSILRAEYFPPKDIWYTPEPINYYYFGHLTGAVLIKLTNILPSIGYNLILSTIFALSITQVFSLITNIINYYHQITKKITNTWVSITAVIYGLLGSFIVNLAGNLHTIYVFTTGYPADNPTPFWQILSPFNPNSYWYPNATRFIPFTIHEFPSYSYVVADLHGHVFDIPFVLLTLSMLFIMIIKSYKEKTNYKKSFIFHFSILNQISNFKFQISKLIASHQLLFSIFLGFLIAIHYMTNAFDGPIYILLSLIIFYFIYGPSSVYVINCFILLASFFIFNLPFSYHFSPFVSGIGVNCSPEFLTKLEKFGPFLFESGNCQISSWWMLFILWGFFWISLAIFLIIKNRFFNNLPLKRFNIFFLILFVFGTFLIIIPEFFYIKDIYPAHFRANTMFKLGYQAFIMMSIASTIVFFMIKQISKFVIRYCLTIIFIFFFFFIAIYPYFAIPSYYGRLDRPAQLDGSKWLQNSYPEDQEIINYLNQIPGQPIILEAQGDSYTDYERISSFTGLPTVAGWWVHEWLWRGSSDIVGNRIPDVESIYQSNDIALTKQLIKKYNISYIIVSSLEKQKYQNINEDKISQISNLIFKSSNGNGAIYQIK